MGVRIRFSKVAIKCADHFTIPPFFNSPITKFVTFLFPDCTDPFELYTYTDNIGDTTAATGPASYSSGKQSMVL